MPGLTLIGRISQTSKHMFIVKLGNWYDHESLLYLAIGRYKWKLTSVEGVFYNLKNDWLMMMPLDRAAVSFYHVTL